MLRFIFLPFLFTLFSLPILASSLYTVNIGAYKDVNILSNKLKELPTKLRKTIEVTKMGDLYKAKTLPTKEKKILTKLLPLYKAVFNDAFILTLQTDETAQSVQIKDIEDEVVVSIVPLDTNVSEIEKIKTLKNIVSHSLYPLITKQTYYLCQERNVGSDKKYIIEAIFEDDTVKYKPILGSISLIPTLYLIKNEKLFLYKEDLYDPDVYSTLEKSFPEYHLFSYWIGDIEINTVRYYHHLKDAKEYYDSL